MIKKIIFIISITLIYFLNASALILKTNEKFEYTKDSPFKKNCAELNIKENKNSSSAVFTSAFILPVKLYGNAVIDQNGNYIFTVEKINFITSWPHGWTSAEFEATGVIKFEKTVGGYKASVPEEIVFWEMTKGEIRYYDDYYIKDKGLQKVKERIIRIKAVTDFLKNSKSFPEYFGAPWLKTTYSDPFYASVNKYLSDKKTVFPENLQKLKNSITLTRDLEESMELFFMYYNFNYFFKNMLTAFTFE